jgi:3-deoxy-D-manno-octulosonic-acid transferase
MARRSEGAAPSTGTPIFLADTVGEMDRWYAMAGACLIGGSLVDRGGHTPYEPGRHGVALLHGPSTRNFAEVLARLDAAGAALPVTADTLSAALQSLNPERQAELARAAEPLLQPADGSSLVAALLDRLQPRG